MIHLGDEHSAKEKEEFPMGITICDPHDKGDSEPANRCLQSRSGRNDKKEIKRASKLYRDGPEMHIIS